ncbi:histidine kinase [Corynebacterium yudongzhengii]|uniref:histidine kinase n=1 Tax=Corynebacterium yudongzhengii TaxID=2080740 RepID=A0A2U1T491_9CORY|nr:ATP-binding protein [Corynebacterium yudongzhengii]AWB82396.1 histidine kinase [Corynebacterium yudongzhengii]PWC00817.1 histidine kinase [Corynebacterium yudongzhengii]
MLPRSTLAIVGKSEATRAIQCLVQERLGQDHEVLAVESVEALPQMLDDDSELALVTVTVHEDGLHRDHPLVDFLSNKRFRHTRIMVLTTAPTISGLDMLTDLGRLDMLVYTPEIKEDALALNIRQQLTRYWHERTRRDPELAGRYDQPESSALDVDLTDQQIIRRIIDAADRHLGYQPRLTFPPGVYLTKEGHVVEEIILALSGRVLLQRFTDAGDITMHHASTGQVIGLLALARSRIGFFTARTTTEVVAVQLPTEQLNYLLELEPDLTRLLAVLFVRSYDRRLRRAEDIQVEQHELTAQLEEERAHLTTALRNLEAARRELMSQARFASLGELAAGVAHELNNPMSAIGRTAEHLVDDVEALLASAPDKKWRRGTLNALKAARTSHAVSTKEARRLHRELTEITGDRALAQRWVLAGLHDPDFARQVGKSRQLDYETVEHAASIGTGLRNLSTAATRITELVASLRSYARPDGDPITDVDVHQGIDDTLHLISHKLRDIDIRREFAELPAITCTPGQLSQVWTNLITNAAEAIEESGKGSTITVRTSLAHPERIRVEVIDDGPGIPENRLENLFEPRFTTRNGQVRFGMGIGLSVCRSIVSKHHGSIHLESSPAGTAAIVELPVDGPHQHNEGQPS